MIIGHYRNIWAYDGLSPLTWNKPFYGIRNKYHPVIKNTVKQILVKSIGGKAWINVDPGEIRLIDPNYETKKLNRFSFEMACRRRVIRRQIVKFCSKRGIEIVKIWDMDLHDLRVYRRQIFQIN